MRCRSTDLQLWLFHLSLFLKSLNHFQVDQGRQLKKKKPKHIACWPKFTIRGQYLPWSFFRSLGEKGKNPTPSPTTSFSTASIIMPRMPWSTCFMAPLRIHYASSLTNRPCSLGTVLRFCIFGGIPLTAAYGYVYTSKSHEPASEDGGREVWPSFQLHG